ncbi:hypothetical protein JCM2811A_21940 [Methylorubrum rhodinum]
MTGPLELCPTDCLYPGRRTRGAGTKNGTASVRGRAGRETDLRLQIVVRRYTMKWSAPVVAEICVGMEVTSYESAEIDTFN